MQAWASLLRGVAGGAGSCGPRWSAAPPAGALGPRSGRGRAGAGPSGRVPRWRVAPAGGVQGAAVLTPLARAGVGLAGATHQQLAGGLAAVDAGAQVVLDQGVAEQPRLDGLRVAVQAAAGRQDRVGGDVAAVAAGAAVLAVRAAVAGHAATAGRSSGGAVVAKAPTRAPSSSASASTGRAGSARPSLASRQTGQRRAAPP